MWYFVSACYLVCFFLVIKLCFLKCTFIFVVMIGVIIGVENEELYFLDGVRFFCWFGFVFEVRFCFCFRFVKFIVRFFIFF